MMAMSLHGCHISYFMADPGRWNFYITGAPGAYQQVMLARGMILKECPIQVRGQKLSYAMTDVFFNPSIVQQSRLPVPRF